MSEPLVVTVGEPEDVGNNPHQESGAAFISQQVKRGEGEHHGSPVATLILEGVFSEIFHRGQCIPTNVSLG